MLLQNPIRRPYAFCWLSGLIQIKLTGEVLRRCIVLLAMDFMRRLWKWLKSWSMPERM